MALALVVSEVEVVVHGVAQAEHEDGEVHDRLAGGVVAVEVLGAVLADHASGLADRRRALGQRLVELHDVRDPFGAAGGGQVLRGLVGHGARAQERRFNIP